MIQSISPYNSYSPKRRNAASISYLSFVTNGLEVIAVDEAIRTYKLLVLPLDCTILLINDAGTNVMRRAVREKNYRQEQQQTKILARSNVSPGLEMIHM
jgi:hypothetical protein